MLIGWRSQKVMRAFEWLRNNNYVHGSQEDYEEYTESRIMELVRTSVVEVDQSTEEDDGNVVAETRIEQIVFHPDVQISTEIRWQIPSYDSRSATASACAARRAAMRSESDRDARRR